MGIGVWRRSGMKHRNRKPLKQEFGLNKKAFDSVMACYKTSQFTGIEATDYAKNSSLPSTPAIYRGKPTTQDFRIDVSLVFRKVVPPEMLSRFESAYLCYDSDDPIENEVVADKLLGKRRHLWEQKCGAEFLIRGIYPAVRYFNAINDTYSRKWESESITSVLDEQQEVSIAANGDSPSCDYADPETAALVEQAYAALDSSMGV
jgi:hypothetical protein